MGKVKVMLKCEAGAKSTVYVLKNQQESLLGRIDCEALGIIVVKSGGNPGKLEQVGRLSTIQLQCERQENQEEIDDKMTKLLASPSQHDGATEGKTGLICQGGCYRGSARGRPSNRLGS